MAKYREVDNSQDILDSRDIIARIEELEGEFDSLIDNISDARIADEGEDYAENLHEAFIALAEWLGVSPEEIENEALNFEALSDYMESDEARELKALKALADEGESSPDWSYGETLIRESYFKEYAQNLAEDIGAINKDQSWPNNCIDWDEAADQLKQDYMEVDFDGVTYLIRA